MRLLFVESCSVSKHCAYGMRLHCEAREGNKIPQVHSFLTETEANNKHYFNPPYLRWYTIDREMGCWELAVIIYAPEAK